MWARPTTASETTASPCNAPDRADQIGPVHLTAATRPTACGNTRTRPAPPGATCSQNQGAGLWAGYQLPDGSIFLMIHFSDLARSNTCFSQTLRPRNGGFFDIAGGMNWQRTN